MLMQSFDLGQLRLKKGVSDRIWETLVLAMIGDVFGLGDEVCGAVLITKQHEDVLAIWNRNSMNKAGNIRIRETLKRILSLDNNSALEYRPHQQAIKNLQSHTHSRETKASPTNDSKPISTNNNTTISSNNTNPAPQ
jgi:translation initiation factor 4E